MALEVNPKHSLVVPRKNRVSGPVCRYLTRCQVAELPLFPAERNPSRLQPFDAAWQRSLNGGFSRSADFWRWLATYLHDEVYGRAVRIPWSPRVFGVHPCARSRLVNSLRKDQSDWLDEMANEIRVASGSKVSRSEIVRAALATLREIHKLAQTWGRLAPLTVCKSGSDLEMVGVVCARLAATVD